MRWRYAARWSVVPFRVAAHVGRPADAGLRLGRAALGSRQPTHISRVGVRIIDLHTGQVLQCRTSDELGVLVRLHRPLQFR